MYQIAIYGEQQHEQHVCSSPRIGLRRSSVGVGNWVPILDLDESPSAASLALQIEDDALHLQSVAIDNLCSIDGRALASGDSVALPCLLKLSDSWLEIKRADRPRPLVPLNESSLDGEAFAPSSESPHAGPAAATVTRWLAEASELHRTTAASSEFYHDAARFAVETVGLDGAWVLRRDENNANAPWKIAGSHLTAPETGICYDSTALKHLLLQTTTWYQQADDDQTERFPQAIVVAPVLDESQHVIGAIYGVRNLNDANRRRSIRPLEARLVQLLADSVAVGIARLQHETEAARARVLLEQAFSPTVAEYIQNHPHSLAGQQREVTLMFADLRGYSALAETLKLTDCYDLLSDVMEALTDVVVRQRGIVVDYYGDGLLALWNAPLEQPNHADLACQTALEMFTALDPVSERWQEQLERPLELGIGIHTGPAFVGNAGTRSRLKYGPRGNTVNVASRVQSATKQLELPLVITAETQTKLTDKFFTLRVCTAKLPGLEQPAQLFTAYPASEAARVKARLEEYSQALELFEKGELEAAEKMLQQLAKQGPATPAQFLAHHATAQKKGNLGRRAVDKYAAGQGAVIEIYWK